MLFAERAGLAQHAPLYSHNVSASLENYHFCSNEQQFRSSLVMRAEI